MLISIILLTAALSAQSAPCYTEQDMKTNVCWALCRQDGYDTGAYVSHVDSCSCAHFKKFREMTEQRIIIHANPPKLKEGPPAPRPPPAPFMFHFNPPADEDEDL